MGVEFKEDIADKTGARCLRAVFWRTLNARLMSKRKAKTGSLELSGSGRNVEGEGAGSSNCLE